MRILGFSTGAIALGDFQRAIRILSNHNLQAIELSALRATELQSLVNARKALDLSQWQYIGFHAPSQYQPDDEQLIVETLLHQVPENWPIIVHPDAMHDFALWRKLGRRIAVENMDRRKRTGRSREEMDAVFHQLPDARFTFDIGHARQYDTTMTEAYRLLTTFSERLAWMHISEVSMNTSRHERISFASRIAFQQVAKLIPENIPLVIESRVECHQIDAECRAAQESLRILSWQETQKMTPITTTVAANF